MGSNHSEIIKVLVTGKPGSDAYYIGFYGYTRHFNTYEEAEAYAIEDIEREINLYLDCLRKIAAGEYEYMRFSQTICGKHKPINYVMREALKRFAK